MMTVKRGAGDRAHTEGRVILMPRGTQTGSVTRFASGSGTPHYRRYVLQQAG